MKAELIADVRNATGESPVWIASEQSLYWVDIPARTLYRWNSTTGQIRHWQGPEMLGCIAPYSDEAAFIAGMEQGFYKITLPKEHAELEHQQLASVQHPAAQMRLNDGRCDRQGRFWAGSMQTHMLGQPVGQLHRYDSATGLTEAVVTDLRVPNGLAFSPDGTLMYLSDSHPDSQHIWVFDYDTETGTPRNQRLFVDMKPLLGRPDGAAIDTDGCYWICANDAGLIYRFTPQGKLDKSVAIPVKKPTMCAFGGSNLDTLFVTSIRPSGDLSDQPLAGGLFALSLDVQGLIEPSFVA